MARVPWSYFRAGLSACIFILNYSSGEGTPGGHILDNLLPREKLPPASRVPQSLPIFDGYTTSVSISKWQYSARQVLRLRGAKSITFGGNFYSDCHNAFLKMLTNAACAMAEGLGDQIQIRKFRKKLRQIENLERLERDLTDEEHAKVYSELCRSHIFLKCQFEALLCER